MKPLLALGAALFSLAASAQTLLPQGAEIVFTSKQMGVPVEGRFKSFKLDAFQFDPKKPEAAKIALTVHTKTAAVGAPEVDAELVKPEWFDAGKFPEAKFVAQSVKALGGGKFEMQGQFTLKGQSKAMSVPLQLTQAGATSTATGSFALKRKDWKIGTGEWADTSIVADEVQVRFKFPFSGMAPL